MTGILKLGLGISLTLLSGLSGLNYKNAQATETQLEPSAEETAIASVTGQARTAIQAEETQLEAIQAEETQLEDLQIAAAPRLRNWLEYPVDLFLLDPNIDPDTYGVITNRTVSQTSLTTPSLWWTQEQFGGKLLENWLAYPGSEDDPRRVDLVVDRQLWSLSNYLERYTFVNRFGTAAKSFGYSIRVFNDQGSPLATYICDFPTSLPTERAIADAGAIDTHDLSCDVSLDSSGAGALRGRSGGFESLF